MALKLRLVEGEHVPDYSMEDCGFMLSKDGMHFACTLYDSVSECYISRYFSRPSRFDPWKLMEQHQCTTVDDADCWTEWKVPNPALQGVEVEVQEIPKAPKPKE